MKIKDKVFDRMVFAFGVYFFILGIVAMVNSFFYLESASFLWICYLSMLLIGIGMIYRSSYFLVMQINIIFIPLLFWNVDFFYRLFFGDSLFGITDYFFLDGLNLVGSFVSLSHIYILPISIYVVYRMGIKGERIWLASFFEAIVVFFLSLFLTNPEGNSNCVFFSCVSFVEVGGIWYNFLWFFSVFVMIYIVNWFLVKFFWNKKK